MLFIGNPTFTSKQKEFLSNPASVRLFLAGFGTGKTFINVVETFYQMMIVHPGYSGLVVAPTFKHLQQGWYESWKKLVPASYWTMNVQQQVIYLNNGSKIFLRYANDGLNLAGINAAFVSIDEAALIDDPEAFKQAMSRLREGKPGQPLRAILTSTPNGYNWLPQEFGGGYDNLKWFGEANSWHNEEFTRATIRAKTTDNPNLPETYIQSLLANSPDWVEQYIMAQYTKAEGLVLKEFDPAIHLVKKEVLPKKFKTIVVGCDWGFTHNGAAIVLGETPTGNYVVIEEHVYKGMIVDKNGWFKVFDKILADWNPDYWCCDPAQPAYIQAMRVHFNQKELVYEANNRRIPGIQKMKSLLHQKKLFIRDNCTNLIQEIQNWKYKSGSEEAEKVGDDGCDALRYGLLGITRDF